MTTATGLPRLPGKGRIFYGWWLTIAGMAGGAMQGLFLGYGFSAFFLPIQTELGVSRAALSAASSLAQLEAGLTGPLNGWLIDRFGPRRLMMIGYLIFGGGFMLISLSPSLWAFYAAYVMMTFGAGLSGFLAVTSTITNWFSRRRAIAVGLTQTGDALGGMLVPLLAVSIAAFGWRATAFAIGPIIILCGLPLASLFRRRPEDVGLLPDGDPPAVHATPNATPPRPPDGLTARQAIRTPAFWLFSMAHSLTLLMITAINVHQIPALVNAGLAPATAALVLSVTTAATVVGRLTLGFLGDRFDRQRALAGCFLGQAIAVVVLAYADSLLMALVFAVLYGVSFGGRGPLLVSIRGDFFGTRAFATIMGLSQTVLMIGTIIGPVFAGWVYDVSGSYQGAFLVMAGINVIAMGFLLAARKPALPTTTALY